MNFIIYDAFDEITIATFHEMPYSEIVYFPESSVDDCTQHQNVPQLPNQRKSMMQAAPRHARIMTGKYQNWKDRRSRVSWDSRDIHVLEMSIRQQRCVDFRHILKRLVNRDKHAIQNHLNKQKREAVKHINMAI